MKGNKPKANQPAKEDLYEAIYSIVRLIPQGRVSTYGAIAQAIGMRSGARMVGYALNSCHILQPPIPAHRVVNSAGLLTGRHHFNPPELMQQLLEQEGITVEDNQVKNFASLLWNPSKEIEV